MDYTLSPEFIIHPSTGQRMHSANQPVPTEMSDKDFNSLIWSMMEVVKAADLAGQQFDPGVPATYRVLRDAIAELVRRGYGFSASAGGTSDAITVALNPAPVALVNGLRLRVRAAAANTTSAPTLTVGTLATLPIVKGVDTPLEAGNIGGAGHWLELTYDALLNKWVLNNPLSLQVLPAGTELDWGSTTAPPGTLKLNGAVPPVSSVPNLVANVYCGDANNATASFYYRCTDAANPTTTRSTTGAYFVLKDARGRFPRSLSDGSSIDSGRSMWAYQDHAQQDHTHTGFGRDGANGSGLGSGVLVSGWGTETTGLHGANVAGENRPTNYPALRIVKI